MSELNNWFGVIEESSKSLRKDQQKIRDIITERGPAEAVYITDAEYDEEIRMWPIEGGVVAIGYRNKKANINHIITYSSEFISALIKCEDKNNGNKIS